ncbi:MAG: 4Fe-4S dicluster domain-containing protein [Dehalococcoidia bacterium]|nr:4Fe-4S dicluster domain-containing protein [Dehalococcoidia bacterium]
MEKTNRPILLDQVASAPGGKKIRECIQCGVCSGSCTTAAYWEYPPRKIIAMVRSDLRDDVLSSSSIWYCVSCHLCTARCPRDIKPADIMHALESLAIKEGYKPPSRTPAMYRSFVDSIRSNGRVYELGFMVRYYLRTNPLAAIKMLPMALSLLSHGRMPLMPKKVKGKDEVKTILEKVRAGGAQ